MAGKYSLIISMRDAELGTKTLTFDNADSAVTVEKISAFVNKYDAVYNADYNVTKAIVRETTDTQKYPSI